MTATQLKDLFASVFKPVPGGPTDKTRAAPVRDALCALVDWVVALVGTGSSASTTYLELSSANPTRISRGIPVPVIFQVTAETLDSNAASISYQLDTNTRTTRVYGAPDRTLAQVNALLAALTPTQISEGTKLYVKTVPTTAANPSTIILALT